MNAEQKNRANELLSAWRATAYALHGDRMADLLQELVDAPEAEPVAEVVADAGSITPVILWFGEKQHPVGTKFYSAPPTPSVPDGWRYVIPGRRRTEKFESARVGDYNQGWNDCVKTVAKALNDLEKRK